MPSRKGGVCRHCGTVNWIVGRGLCPRCHRDDAIRDRYPSRRPYNTGPVALCSHCELVKRLHDRGVCLSCYRDIYHSIALAPEIDPEREARIQRYCRRAALGLPLFEEEPPPASASA